MKPNDYINVKKCLIVFTVLMTLATLFIAYRITSGKQTIVKPEVPSVDKIGQLLVENDILLDTILTDKKVSMDDRQYFLDRKRLAYREIFFYCENKGAIDLCLAKELARDLEFTKTEYQRRKQK